MTIMGALAKKYAAHKVSLLILPYKTAVMDDREQRERQDVKDLRAELEANDWDADKVAPYPRGHDFLALGKYQFLHKICRKDYERPDFREVAPAGNPPGYTAGLQRTNYVKMDDKLVERYIVEQREAAAEEYDAFVYKLCGKVGDDVVKAELEEARDDASHGYALWMYSILRVTKTDGAVERWKTKSIINRSKYGRLFRQYPSRKLAD